MKLKNVFLMMLLFAVLQSNLNYTSAHNVELYQQDNKQDVLSYIRNYGENPKDYIINKLKNHYVVMIGEDHWIKDHMIFMSEMITFIGNDKDIHVDAFAIEFGNSSNQDLADEFIKSPVYREDLVIKILQNAPDLYGWPYLEAVGIFKSIWESNNRNPQQNKTRILLLDPPYVIPYLDKEEYDYTVSRDMSQANIIQRYIRRGKRVLFYGGSAHTSSRVHGDYNNETGVYSNYHSAGFILKTLYPSLVFSIELWGG